MSPAKNFNYFSSDHDYAKRVLTNAWFHFYGNNLILEADDLTTIAYLFMCDAWKNFNKNKVKTPFRNYLRKFVVYSFMNYVRKHKLYKGLTFDDSTYAEMKGNEWLQGEQEHNLKRQRTISMAKKINKEVLERFKPKDKMMISLYLRGRFLIDLAREFNVSRSHIYYVHRRYKSLLHKARKHDGV